MTSSRVKASLKQKSKNFSAAKLDSTTPKAATVTPGTTTIRQKPSARENEAVYEISRM